LLYVRDDGPGHPDSVLIGHGWGSGLEVVKSLAEQHGGKLTLSNNQGAEVELLLPLK
jgi:two-component sensor histidine kinase